MPPGSGTGANGLTGRGRWSCEVRLSDRRQRRREDVEWNKRIVRDSFGQVITMSAILRTVVPGRGPVAPRVDLSPAACECGQDLDDASGTHCPRCGTRLGAAFTEATGFGTAA